MDTNSRDEVRVIVALGVVAGIVTYFQLRGSNIPFLSITHTVANSAIYPDIIFELYATVFVFSSYLLLFTLALAVDVVRGT